jgi:hypothetical protein
VRIDHQHPLASCKRRVNWKTGVLCHSRCGTIKIPPCSKAIPEKFEVSWKGNNFIVKQNFDWKNFKFTLFTYKNAAILETDVKKKSIYSRHEKNQTIYSTCLILQNHGLPQVSVYRSWALYRGDECYCITTTDVYFNRSLVTATFLGLCFLQNIKGDPCQCIPVGSYLC